jgi:hypothetical protein
MEDDLQRLLQAQTQDSASQVAGATGGSPSVVEQLVFLAENERSSPDIQPYPHQFLARLQSDMASRRDEIERLRAQQQQSARPGAANDADASALLMGLHSGGGGGGGGGSSLDASASAFPGLGRGGAAASSSSSLPFRVADLLDLELVRVRYALADLVRVRLQKLQFFRAAIVADRSRFESLLSENELVLVQGLHDIFTTAALAGGIAKLPEPLRAEPAAAVPKPDVNTYVLATALAPCEVQLPGIEEPRRLNPGESAICPYHCVRLHLLDGRLRLIC